MEDNECCLEQKRFIIGIRTTFILTCISNYFFVYKIFLGNVIFFHNFSFHVKGYLINLEYHIVNKKHAKCAYE